MVSIYNGILFILKRKDILSLATTWMNLEDIMLRGISQTKKEKGCMPHLCMESKEVKYTEAEPGLGGEQAGAAGNRRCWSEGTESQWWGMKKSADLMPSVMTAVNNPVLNTGNLINMYKDHVPWFDCSNHFTMYMYIKT